MNSTSQTAGRLAGTIVLAGVALFAAAPAYAHVAPDDSTAGSNPSKAQIEHQESTAVLRPPHPPKSSVGTSNPSDPSSVPTILLAVLGGTVVAGGVGFTVHRVRHHAPLGAATA